MQSRFDLPRYTYNDYKNWKEDWELVNGYPYQMLPSASPKHSKTQGKFIYQAENSLNKNSNCNCIVFPELDWKINDDTVVRPNIMIICGEPKNEVLEFPPVLIIEILSPYNLKTDRVLKFELYRENGVKYYLMVDVQKENVEVYQLVDNFYKQVEISKFQLDKTCEIEFDFESIWK
jgi:Uma2 family endonuclease